MWQKTRTISLAIAVALIIISLVSAFFTAVIIYNTGVIKAGGPEDPLEAWSEASYIAWKYNSTHTAVRNMSTRVVSWLGSNASQILQSPIDNLNANYGGLIFVKQGNYSDASVTVKSKVTFIMEYGVSGLTATTSDSGIILKCVEIANKGYVVYEAILNMTGHQIVGMVFHSGTTSERNALSAIVGQPFYDTDDHTLYVWNSTDWVNCFAGAVGAQGPAGKVYGLPFSYLVFKNATSTYKVNGDDGGIDWNNADSRLVIQACLGNMSDGETLFIKASTYDVSSGTIHVPDNLQGIVIYGEGEGTILQGEKNINSTKDIISIGSGVSYLAGYRTVIYNMKFVYGRSAVLINMTRGCSISECFFLNQMKYGIWFWRNPDEFLVEQCHFELKDAAFNWGYYDCIRIEQPGNVAGVNSGLMQRVSMYHTSSNNITEFRGIVFHQASTVTSQLTAECMTISTCKWWAAGQVNGTGILFESLATARMIARSILIEELMFESNYQWQSGIRIKNTYIRGLKIIGGSYGFNSVEPNQFALDLYDALNFNEIEFVMPYCSYAKLLRFKVGSHYGTIHIILPVKENREELIDSGDIPSDPEEYGIYVRSHDEPYVFKKGVAEASNDDWIQHGMLKTPSTVILTVQESDATYSIQCKATNSTHLQIYLYDITASELETVDKTICWLVYP